MTNIRKNSIVYLDNETLDMPTVSSIFRNMGVDQIAKSLSEHELKLMVKTYYIAQEHRIRLDNQIFRIEKYNKENPDDPRPIKGLIDTADYFRSAEDRQKNIMDIYTSLPENRNTLWAKSIHGIGPVLSAGFVVNIDITKSPTCSNILSYFGQNPMVKWITDKDVLKEMIKNTMEEHNKKVIDDEVITYVCAKMNRKPGQCLKFLLRLCQDKNKEKPKYKDLSEITQSDAIKCLKLPPFNIDMKVLCWKLAESFVKVSNSPKDIYGSIIQQRKIYEITKNENGEYAEQAEQKLRDFNIGKQTDAYKFYISGKLPPAHIMARAKRYGVKIFISHLHAVMYWCHYGKLPPAPYAMGILGHSDLIGIPNPEVVGFPIDEYMRVGKEATAHAHSV